MFTETKGFTLLEVLVSTVIFAAVVSGLSATFISAKRHLLHTKSKIQAVEIARGQCERLYSQVREDTWDNSENLLTPGTYPSEADIANPPADPTKNYQVEPTDNSNIAYNYYYIVSEVDENLEGLRKVEVTINWNEP